MVDLVNSLTYLYIIKPIKAMIEQIKLKEKLRVISHKDIIEGGYGWKVVGLDELTYASYPAQLRIDIEIQIKWLLERSDTIDESERVKLFFFLVDETYRWLVINLADKVNKRLNELLDKYEFTSYFKSYRKIVDSEKSVDISENNEVILS